MHIHPIAWLINEPNLNKAKAWLNTFLNTKDNTLYIEHHYTQTEAALAD